MLKNRLLPLFAGVVFVLRAGHSGERHADDAGEHGQ